MSSINKTRNKDRQMLLVSTVTVKGWSALLESPGIHSLFDQGRLGNLFTCTVIQLLDEDLLRLNCFHL